MFIEIEEMMLVSVWIWWTAWVLFAIQLRFQEKRWKRERQLEKEIMEEQRKQKGGWDDEISKLN